jgi:DNA (cytosine-5)-methyltransferase 1
MIDLFCGCGGISRGFERTGRFATEFGVELEKHPIETFVANIRNSAGEPPRAYHGDIDLLAGDTSLMTAELGAAGINGAGELDVLAGGPPCQGFSRNGVRLYSDDKGERFYDNPKNHLYKSFLRFVDLLRPKMVLVENVREFLNFGGGKFSSDLVARFRELGYVVESKKLCAADFGVAQVRHRVFFVAVRNDVADATGLGPTFPKVEFHPASTGSVLLGDVPYRTVRDAIGDLPPPSHDKKNGGTPYPNDRPVSALARELRSPGGLVLNHIARELSPKQVARINAVGSGRMKHIDPNLQTEAFYGSAYRRLSWDEPALTITTWVYHVGSGRYAHPDEDRGITMREAARLQSFDDDFVFSRLVNPVSQMIGNAVPPLLASKFAKEFVHVLDAFAEVSGSSTFESAALTA